MFELFNHWIYTSILLIFGLLYAIYFIFDSYLYDINKKRLPGPSHHLFGERYLLNFINCAKSKQLSKAFTYGLLKYGNNSYFATHIFSEPTVVIGNPEFVKLVLSGGHNKFLKTHMYSRMESYIGKGLVTSQGIKWQSDRKLINPGFHSNELQHMIKIFNIYSSSLINELIYKLTFNSTNTLEIDIDKDICYITLSIILSVGFGLDMNDTIHSQGIRDNIKILLDEIAFRLGDPTDWWYKICYFRQKKASEAYKKVDLLVNLIISDRLQSVQQIINKNRDLLDILIDANSSNDDNKLTSSDIKDHILTFVAAGSDTSSSAIQSVLYKLANHPDIQLKCYNEIKSLYNPVTNDFNLVTVNLSYEDINKFVYLQQVIKETLRLYSPIPLLGKNNTEVIKFDGFELPKQTTFLLNIYNIHRHPKYWENPDKFDPDRFATENVSKFHPFQYIPFSLGPRNCIGQRFAMFEIISVLVPLLYYFEFTMNDLQLNKVSYEETITYHLKNVNCFIHLRK